MADTWQQIGQAGRAVAHRIDPSADTCPTCHQRVLTRHGVKLSRRQADMFDMVERATSRGGIDAGVLAELMNPGKPMRDARNLTRVTINQLNVKFARARKGLPGN